MTTITTIFEGKKTRNSIYMHQTIQNLLTHLAFGKIKYNLTTKTGRKCFHTALCKAMELCFSRYDIPSVMKSFGIGSPDSLANEIIDNADFLASVAKLNLKGLIIEKRLTKNQMKGKTLVEENGAGTNPYDVNEVSLNDVERLVVVRTKYGTHEPKMYTIKGSLTSETANTVKAMYAYESGCNYYEVRPILYTTWIILPDEYKMASRPCEEDDLKYANE